MHRYEFFCRHCGLLFEKLVQDVNTQETECKSCKQVAKKKFKPHSVGITYKDGLPPTPDIDHLVGADSEKRWGRVNEIHTQANKIRKDSSNPVVEVSPTGELKSASSENVAIRKQVADSVFKGQ